MKINLHFFLYRQGMLQLKTSPASTNPTSTLKSASSLLTHIFLLEIISSIFSCLLPMIPNINYSYQKISNRFLIMHNKPSSTSKNPCKETGNCFIISLLNYTHPSFDSSIKSFSSLYALLINHKNCALFRDIPVSSFFLPSKVAILLSINTKWIPF